MKLTRVALLSLFIILVFDQIAGHKYFLKIN